MWNYHGVNNKINKKNIDFNTVGLLNNKNIIVSMISIDSPHQEKNDHLTG